MDKQQFYNILSIGVIIVLGLFMVGASVAYFGWRTCGLGIIFLAAACWQLVRQKARGTFNH